MIQRTPIRRTPREKPRRERPELFFKPEKTDDSWRSISWSIRCKWWNESELSGLLCGICGKEIRFFGDLVPDHIEPGKMGGCKDHSESNLQPAHSWCNLEKGSKRNFGVGAEVKDGEK